MLYILNNHTKDYQQLCLRTLVYDVYSCESRNWEELGAAYSTLWLVTCQPILLEVFNYSSQQCQYNLPEKPGCVCGAPHTERYGMSLCSACLLIQLTIKDCDCECLHSSLPWAITISAVVVDKQEIPGLTQSGSAVKGVYSKATLIICQLHSLISLLRSSSHFATVLVRQLIACRQISQTTS